MGRSKDDFIEKTGGFRVAGGPSPTQRYQLIAELEGKLKAHEVPAGQIAGVMQRIQRLKGMTSDEWRTYEEDNEND